MPEANLRRIRSFVRRQGRITKAQQQALETLLPVYGLSVNDGIVDLTQVFQREAPCIVEIGFGMGHTLLELATNNPENNYIGIEVHEPGIGTLLQGIEKQDLSNIRVYTEDAIDVLTQCLPDHSLAAVLLFFPDPWHKKRHHKRRIVNANFVNLIQQKLLSGGLFHLATDWQNYAQQMLAVLSDYDGFVNQAGTGQFAARPDSRPLTKFEQRGIRLGHDVWDLLFRTHS